MSSGDDLSSDDQTVRTLRKKAAESIEESDGKDKMFYLNVRIRCFISTLPALKRDGIYNPEYLSHKKGQVVDWICIYPRSIIKKGN